MFSFKQSNVLFNSEVLKCALCQKLLNDPVQLNNCGHRICSVCFQKSRNNFEARGKCPVCFVESKEPRFYQDSCIQQEIAHLNMPCPGCHNVVQVAAFWDQHSEICPGLNDGFVEVLCERCNINLFQHQMMTHNDLNCGVANIAYPVDADTILPDGVPTRYQCATCHEILIPGYQCHGGHRSCSGCIAEDLGCPMNVCEKKCFRDNALWRDIEESVFKCSNSDNCDWKDRYNLIQDHEEELCEFRTVDCHLCQARHPFKEHIAVVFTCNVCGGSFLEQEAQEHVCPDEMADFLQTQLVSTECQGCHEVVSVQGYEDHIENCQPNN